MKRTPLKQGRGFSASPAQRKKVKGLPCVVCGRSEEWDGTKVDPAHLMDRSMGGGDDPLEVVPLCRWPCHHDYDTGKLSLLEHLGPGWSAEIAFAVEKHGLIMTLQRLTNSRWAPEREAA